MDESFEDFSNFTIVKAIGTGSFGTVFESLDKKTGAKVALKICPLGRNHNVLDSTKQSMIGPFQIKKHDTEIKIDHFTGDYDNIQLAMSKTCVNQNKPNYKQIEKDLETEIHIHSLIDSRFFPKFHWAKRCGDFIIISMQFCPGITLDEFLMNPENNSLINEDLIISILNQILDATLYLHSHNIMHRDIKLENIIISSDFSIKICDFGFANFFDDNSLVNEFCGSVQYCSPEVVSNTPYHGPKNDIWTIGVCILKLCVGNALFHDISDGKGISSLYSVLEKNVESYKLRMLLKSIIQEDPRKRPNLDTIYSSLKLEMPPVKPFNIRYLDIVIIHHMKLMGHRAENILVDSRISTSGHEPKVYRLLHEKIYNANDNQFKLSEDQLSMIYINNIKHEKTICCCKGKEYLEFTFLECLDIESLMKSSNLLYSYTLDICLSHILKFHMYQLVIELIIIKKKNGLFCIQFINLSGNLDDFAVVIQRIMSSYNRIENGQN